jgi:hypothetical protein
VLLTICVVIFNMSNQFSEDNVSRKLATLGLLILYWDLIIWSWCRKMRLLRDLKFLDHLIQVTTMHIQGMKMRYGTHLQCLHTCNTRCLATLQVQTLLKRFHCHRMWFSTIFTLRTGRPHVLWWHSGSLIASIQNLSLLCYTNLFKGGVVPALSMRI